MKAEKRDFSTFMLNLIDFMSFGFGLYRNGVCDERIKNEYKLVNDSEIYGITKKKASEILGISVRQFDRYVKQGKILKGKKFRNKTLLYWDENYIRHIKTSISS